MEEIIVAIGMDGS